MNIIASLSVSLYTSSSKSFAMHFFLFLILFITFSMLAFLTLKGEFPIDLDSFSLLLKGDKCANMHTDGN